MPSVRITQGMTYLETLGHLQRNYARLFRDQSALGSGRRVTTASDDPEGAARILGYARTARGIAGYRETIAAADLGLNDTAAELQAIGDVFHQVRERVVQGLSGTLSDADRASIAAEIDEHLTSMLAHANGQSRGGFLFAGTRTDSAPFHRFIGPDGLERVRYSGNALANRIEVSPGAHERIAIPGSELIDVGPRTATTYAGATGARPGLGTDTGVGRAVLVVSHTITGFGPQPGALVDPASGLKAGASSAANDTVLGFGHAVDLVVNGAGTGGTVRLNGGPAITFTSSDTDLAVTGPGGERVHLDLSGVAAGFNGSVALNSYGSLSLDGGQTTTAINFGLNALPITNPVDGTVTYVDATGITRTGSEDVTYGGTLDLFNALLAIRDLLRTTGTPQDVTSALDQARLRLADVDRGHEAILSALTEAGSISNRILSLDDRLADVATKVAARRSEIEDADLATLVSSLKENEAVYESSLLVAARLGRISLNNFLG